MWSAGYFVALASDSFFVPISWPQIAAHVLGQVVLFPLALQRLVGRGRDDEQVGLPAQLFQALADEGNGGTPRTISPIVSLTAFDQASACFRSGSPVALTAASSAGLASFVSRFDPVDQRLRESRSRRRGPCTSGRSRSHSSASIRAGKRLMPAALRIQIDELGRLAGVLADALQLVVVDDVGNEALLVLHLHRVERAAVGIDADQKIVLAV